MLPRMNFVAELPMASGLGPEVFFGSGEFYRTALESLAEGVMILDADCRIINANRLVCEITGYSPEELLGQTPYLLRANPEPTECPAAKGPPDEPSCFEFEMKRKDGRLH